MMKIVEMIKLIPVRMKLIKEGIQWIPISNDVVIYYKENIQDIDTITIKKKINRNFWLGKVVLFSPHTVICAYGNMDIVYNKYTHEIITIVNHKGKNRGNVINEEFKKELNELYGIEE